MPHMSHYNPLQPRVPKHHEGGGRWTRERDEFVQPAFYAGGRFLWNSAVDAGLAAYSWLSALNSAGKRAIIGFNARDYRGATKILDLADIRLLDREQVGQACPKLGEVQSLTDKAAAVVQPQRSFLTAGQYGTIRIDVFEEAPNQTVCVYDIKTGKRGLSPARMLEIATKVFAAYNDVKRIIITEIRPSR
jgi:hypothetical protein